MWSWLRLMGVALLLLPPAVACNDARPETEPVPAVVGQDSNLAAGSQFDANATGAIQGRVRWEGPLPEAPPFKVRSNAALGKDAFRGLIRERPNVPLVDPESTGLAEAVIFLRGVARQRSRPWNHPLVRVEVRDMRMRILQGESVVRTGFVRRGEAITMVSYDRPYQILHGSGADYFTFTFPEPGQPRSRRAERAGLIELTSASGCYWMRGYAFVSDHPYYTRSDSQGRFRLEQVPPGQYELVCWLPNWNIAGQDRDPEWCLVTRVFLAAPLEQVKSVTVERGSACAVDFTVYAAAFSK